MKTYDVKLDGVDADSPLFDRIYQRRSEVEDKLVDLEINLDKLQGK